MGRHGQQVHFEVLHIQLNGPNHLHGITVEGDAVCLGQLPDFGDRLQRADFIIGRHDTNENSVRPDSRFNIGGVDQAILVNRYLGLLKAVIFTQLINGLAHGAMFDGAGDDMLAFAGQFLRPGHPTNSHIIRLGTTGSEDDFLWATI